ncbi:MAG: ROK family transcriptional regulator [Acidobacteriota bacterium]
MKKINLKLVKTANHKILRDINELIVLNVVRERQPISRVAISEVTGLEEGTVSRIVQRFLNKGMVYEAGVGQSTPAGGRKPRFLHINPTKSCAIGVDIGAFETLLALSDFNGHLQHLKKLPNGREPKQFLTMLADEILALARRANPYSELGGIGVSLIGLVDIEEGTIFEGENLGWGEYIEVGKILRSRIGKEIPLYFENGARLSALAEIWFGTTYLSGFRDVVFVDVNEGVGTGIIVNGQIYRGFGNGAGEFGHITIDPQGPKCSCGNVGCLEVFASDLATVRRYKDHVGLHERSDVSQHSKIDMNTIIDLARAGHPQATEALRETAGYLGIGLAPIIYGLNPEAIVIGGRIAEAWSLVESRIIEACAQRVSPIFLQNTKILPSTLHVRPCLMGAIALVLAQNFGAPEIV